MFDVVWSESQKKWVARAAYLRFVGDVYHQKSLSEQRAINMALHINIQVRTERSILA